MVGMLNRLLSAAAVLAAVFCPNPGFAQAPRDGRLVVTVVDQTGGVLPGPPVPAGGRDDGKRGAATAPVTATEQGIATFTGLRPGRYALKAEFPGFDPLIDADV